MSRTVPDTRHPEEQAPTDSDGETATTLSTLPSAKTEARQSAAQDVTQATEKDQPSAREAKRVFIVLNGRAEPRSTLRLSEEGCERRVVTGFGGLAMNSNKLTRVKQLIRQGRASWLNARGGQRTALTLSGLHKVDVWPNGQECPGQSELQ